MGGKQLGKIGNRDAVDYFSEQLIAEARMHRQEPFPSAGQVAMVMHALANHTMIQFAMTFDPDAEGPWSQATSVGRFLHAMGDRYDLLAAME